MVSVGKVKDVHYLLKSIGSFSGGQAAVVDFDSDNIEKLTIQIRPNDGLYKGGCFKFEINLEDYPDGQPSVTCMTKIYHPNIELHDEHENVCLNILDNEWGSELSLEDVVQGLLFLFYEPNLDDPLSLMFEPGLSYEEFTENVKKSLLGEEVEGEEFPHNLDGNGSEKLTEKGDNDVHVESMVKILLDDLLDEMLSGRHEETILSDKVEQEQTTLCDGVNQEQATLCDSVEQEETTPSNYVEEEKTISPDNLEQEKTTLWDGVDKEKTTFSDNVKQESNLSDNVEQQISSLKQEEITLPDKTIKQPVEDSISKSPHMEVNNNAVSLCSEEENVNTKENTNTDTLQKNGLNVGFLPSFRRELSKSEQKRGLDEEKNIIDLQPCENDLRLDTVTSFQPVNQCGIRNTRRNIFKTGWSGASSFIDNLIPEVAVIGLFMSRAIERVFCSTLKGS